MEYWYYIEGGFNLDFQDMQRTNTTAVHFFPRSSFTNINSGAISSTATQLATTYMVTPEMAGFEAGSPIDGFSDGAMVFPGAVVRMNNIFDAPLLCQLSHPLHEAAVHQPSLFLASSQI